MARLSYSALESYKRCGYRFYLERVVKLPRAGVKLAGVTSEPAAEDGDQLALAPAAPVAPEPPGVSALLRGTIVHELLERLDFAGRELLAGRRWSGRQRRTVWPSRRRTSAHGRSDRTLSLIRGVRAHGRSARRVRRELPFAYALEPDGLGGRSVLINGVVDVHADEGDRLLVVDYKTDALDGRDPAEVCDEKYSGQRLVYALAGLRSGAGEVEVAYCFLERPDPVVSSRFAQDVRASLEHELLRLAGGVIAGHFSPTDRPHRELCQFCPGQPALCSWTPDRTLAERPEGETFSGPEAAGPLA